MKPIQSNVTLFPNARKGDQNLEEIYSLSRTKLYMLSLDKNATSELLEFTHLERRLTVLEGAVVISATTGETRLLKGQSSSVPIGVKHRVVNVGKIQASILDQRDGSYPDETGYRTK